MGTVLIDTPSLSDVSCNGARREAFVERLNVDGHRLVLSIHVLEELICGNRPGSIAARANGVGKLIDRMGPDQLITGQPFHVVVQREVSADLTEPPGLAREDRRAIARFLNRADPKAADFLQLSRECNQALKAKQRAFDTDKKVAGFLAGKKLLGTSTQVRELEAHMAEFSQPAKEFGWFLTDLLQHCDVRGENLDILEVTDARSRLSCLRIHLCLAQLTMHGAALAGRSQAAVARLFKPNENNWYDNAIIAVSAHCDLVVSDDIDLIGKVNFLNQRGIAVFRGMHLNAFLS